MLINMLEGIEKIYIAVSAQPKGGLKPSIDSYIIESIEGFFYMCRSS